MTMQAEIETDHNVLRLFFSLKIEKCFFFFSKQAKMFFFFIKWDKTQIFNFVLHLHSVSLTKKNMQYYFGCFLFINNNLQQKDMVVYIIYNDSNINRGELTVYV